MINSLNNYIYNFFKTALLMFNLSIELDLFFRIVKIESSFLFFFDLNCGFYQFRGNFDM